MECAIETENLTKKFGDFFAVDNLSLTIEKGEIFGLLGPNGAGKTTTIKMLATLLQPTSGFAKVWHHNILKEQDAVRRSIGIVFQDTSIDTELTGIENLDFHARMYGLNKEVREKRIAGVLDLVELNDRANVFVKLYSGGMQRRLEIARGLMHYPNVLFLDEPTLGLSVENGETMIPRLLALAHKEGVSVQSVSLRKPTLEDVFLHFTGKTIREQEASVKEQVRMQAKARMKRR